MRSPGIHVVPALSGVSRRLTEGGTQPAWSPDGKSIAYTDLNKPTVNVTEFYFPDDGVICVVPSGGGAARPLMSGGAKVMGRFPSWSPDGSEIRFVKMRDGPSLWTIRVHDGVARERFHLDHTGSLGSPVFSRDDRFLYYVDSHVNGNVSIRVLRLDPGTLTPQGEPETILQPNLAVARDLSLSPDGKHLLYSLVSQHSRLRIQSMKGDMSSGEPSEVTSETGYRYALPKWAPDSTRVVFTRFSVGRPPEILTSKLDGEPPVQVPVRDGNIAKFSPDGNWVMYGTWVPTGDKRSGLVVQRISLQDGSIQTMAKVSDPVDQFDVRPDGTDVIYHTPASSGTQLMRLRFADGTRTQLTSGSVSYGFGRYSLDGKWIAISELGPADRKAVFMPSAGGPVETLVGLPGIWFPAGWSPDADKVLVAGYTDYAWSLYWASRTTRKLQRLSKPLPLRAFVRYPEWSPDGKRIVYEYNESKGNVFVAELGLRK
jgi:Tol biopolymer transport system component